NYTSLLYQRLYHDRTKWRKSDTADAVLHVVVYNGDNQWDAPMTLAGLVERTAQDGAAHLALSYEVIDLVAVRGDALPRSNLLRWVAEVEQSVQAGALPERVRELGEWLAEAGEPGLTRTFDLWLGALGRKWGVELPSIREYEEASAVLAEKIDRWGAEILEQGIEQGIERGIEREKALLRRLAERRFGPAAAERLATVLADVTDADRLAETGEWIVDCATTAEFLARIDRCGS
ncbi:MAG: Rpn family recombination-promoting nuclease/putative transposase, partial [Spirochaetaceae bacterium]|nr:Rpn family recombination-promoting nuclease/putative transposase [Spirochaetaceae bacterium]